MTQPEQIERQRTLIRERLRPLMTRRCVLLDCPYHSNIGDTLIWEGELAFLKECGCEIAGYGSIDTWDYRSLPDDIQLIIHGGGNFGDVWREHHEKRMKVFEVYAGHRITIFPQTVHYDDPALMAADAERLAAHPDLTICARDQRSFDLLSRNFRNKALLVPDMAFYIDPASLRKYASARKTTKTLYLKRNDKEFDPSAGGSEIPPQADIRDWPTLERKTFLMWVIYKLSGAAVRLRNRKTLPRISSLLARTADRLAFGRMRQGNLKTGVRFMSPYPTVVSTRLHGVILAMLLGTERIVVRDNSYGKLSAYYDTWLAGTDGIRIDHGINREP